MKRREKISETEKILGHGLDVRAEDVRNDAVPSLDPEKVSSKWKPYYKKLLAARDYLIDQHHVNSCRAGENQPDIVTQLADAGTETFLRDFSLGMASNYQEMLEEVNDAIQRIAAGTYGICERTGKSIPRARLNAVPWARFTVEAEADMEKEGGGIPRPSLASRFADSSGDRQEPVDRPGAGDAQD
jgi:RNA polymerase-binding transcription factor DksA